MQELVGRCRVVVVWLVGMECGTRFTRERGGAWLLCDYQAGDEFDQGFTTPSQYLKELFIYWLIDFVSSMDNYFSA